MRSNSQYLSVLTTAASDGSYGFDLTTLNVSPNITLSVSITGILEGDDEETIATAIEDQLKTLFNSTGASYSGTPVFTNESVPATFQVSRTEFSVCIWSQAKFTVTSITNTTGSIIEVEDSPGLVTLSQFEDISTVYGVSLQDANGNSFSDNQICDVIMYASNKLTTLLNNNIVSSTYLDEYRGKDTKSIFLKQPAINSFDAPAIRRKSFYDIFYIPLYSNLSYILNYTTGELTYRFNNNLAAVGEPFALDNEIKITYIAGYNHIPLEIKTAVVELASLVIGSGGFSGAGGNITELSGASFTVKFGKKYEALKMILIGLSKYKV